MTDNAPKPPPGPPASDGDVGCAIFGVPVAVVIAAGYIFDSSVRAGSAWAGSAAVAALALMAVGVVWVLVRGRR
jgi:hypothetical protein